eukprot:TRINITY_DN1162_c0_g1_i1.p3 TRINITY_DN1162_c0_g1~~TRINITY_DN1162_c0_g1_i1.p3  ORF type:complete len:59 (+),score=19.67 TRINITY_DN1162_c0_g1_i1:320-496(+)
MGVRTLDEEKAQNASLCTPHPNMLVRIPSPRYRRPQRQSPRNQKNVPAYSALIPLLRV